MAKRIPFEQRRVAVHIMIRPETRLKLDRLADQQRETVSAVGAKAIETYVKRNAGDD